MDFFIPLLAVILLVAPLILVYRRKQLGKNPRVSLLLQIGAFFGFLVISSAFGVGNAALAAETAATAATATESLNMGLSMIAAALAVGLAGIGGGIGVATSAAAAIGAISENDAMFGKSLIFVALAEGIALYGLLISFMILNKF